MKSSTAIPPISIEPDVPAPLSYHRPFLNCLVRLAHAPAPLLCIFTQPDNSVTTHSVGRLRSTTQRGLLPALADTSSHPLRPSACKCTIHLLGPNPRQKEYVFRNPTMLTSGNWDKFFSCTFWAVVCVNSCYGVGCLLKRLVKI